MTPDNLIPALHDIVGAANVLTGDDCAEYESDWRQRVRGKALCVVRPGCTAEVAAVVRACAQAGVSIVPQGGNTGLVEGSVPDASGGQIILSLRRMQTVRAIDAANMTMTVDAGCVLQSLQDVASEAGMLFPLSLGAEGSCTIGGNLATNAGGTQVLRYGNARELCLGLEVVLADGQVWENLQGLRKDNTGYDLRNLFIGSEGTLGIITAATLRLYPQPAAQLTAWAAAPSLQAATALLALSHRHLSAALTGFEVMSQEGLRLVDTHYPHLRVPMWRETMWCVLLEASDSESEAHARAQFNWDPIWGPP
jgi:FAD/FMN-containing dehydrogenase